jgi:hypothetical protein
MTIQDLKEMDCLHLTPAQVGKVLGVDPHAIRLQAQNDPSKLGFPVIVINHRTYIPRLPFIQFMTELQKKTTH